jgi:hypothetical protein
MTFVQRKLKATFTLAGGSSGGPTTFAESGGNTTVLENLRMSAHVSKGGGRAFGTMDLRIYGMTLSLMNQLCTLGVTIGMVQRSQVTLEGGDDQSGMTTVFIGNVMNAWGDFASMPDVPFNVQANAGAFLQAQSASPTSYNGSVDIVNVMQTLAQTANLQFVNGGVSGKMPSTYLWGSPMDQIQQAAKNAGIFAQIDVNTLYIWPKNGTRGSSGVTVSPETGMIGYPSFTNQGIVVKTLYNPSIGVGQTVQVQSQLTRANGSWSVMNFDLQLDAQMPHGQWSQTLYCYNPKYPFPIR